MLNINYIKLDNLIELRINNHLKQIEVATYLSYERSYYSKIENGIYELKIKDACKLCLLLNCDIYYIYGINRHYEPLDDETRSLIEIYLKMTLQVLNRTCRGFYFYLLLLPTFYLNNIYR